MADNLVTTRLAVKEVAMEHDIYATFMPKPLEGYDGSGMHLHLSLFEDDENVFYEAGAEYGLSKVARGFIAGLLHHGREITAVTNQWVNSYKRLVTGFDAPVYEQWGRNDQSAVVPVPSPSRASRTSTRIEYRSPDGACNPYLAFSRDPGRRSRRYRERLRAARRTQTRGRRAPRASTGCPATSPRRSTRWSGPSWCAATLGEHVFEWFLRNKREEWDRYQSHVSQFELKTYLPVL